MPGLRCNHRGAACHPDRPRRGRLDGGLESRWYPPGDRRRGRDHQTLESGRWHRSVVPVGTHRQYLVGGMEPGWCQPGLGRRRPSSPDLVESSVGEVTERIETGDQITIGYLVGPMALVVRSKPTASGRLTQKASHDSGSAWNSSAPEKPLPVPGRKPGPLQIHAPNGDYLMEAELYVPLLGFAPSWWRSSTRARAMDCLHHPPGPLEAEVGGSSTKGKATDRRHRPRGPLKLCG